MYTTRTGGFGIGFREVGSMKMSTEESARWALENGFSALDVVGASAAPRVAAVRKAGLEIGSIDLPDWKALLSPDAGKRKAAVQATEELVRQCSVEGAAGLRLFTVMLPEDPARPRAENFGYMVESCAALVPTLEKHGARIAIEGWPGPGCVCCTPEGFRALLKECPSKSVGINYDPSHLIRMGIDPLRFLSEFADRVCHVHGKDTEILDDSVYTFGREVPAIFETPIRYGSFTWRYTIPGHGVMRWTEALRILAATGYRGFVCIELEDARFNTGTVADEKTGLELGALHLSGC